MLKQKRNRIIAVTAASLALVGGITAGAVIANATEPTDTPAAAAVTPTPDADVTPENGNGGSQNGGSQHGEPRNRRGNRTQVDPASVTVTETQAEAAAVAAVGGGEATRATLRAGRGEDANPTWRVSVTNDEQSFKVSVDAMTGEAGEPQQRVAGEGRGHRRGANGSNGNGSAAAENASATA